MFGPGDLWVPALILILGLSYIELYYWQLKRGDEAKS